MAELRKDYQARVQHHTEVVKAREAMPYRVRDGKGQPSFILPWLLLGDDRTASDREMLASLGVRRILNVSRDVPQFFEGQESGEGIEYMRIAVDDQHVLTLLILLILLTLLTLLPLLPLPILRTPNATNLNLFLI
jgi:hypothetical protein